MTIYLRSKPARCPGCGMVNHKRSGLIERSYGKGSGIFAAEGICLDGRRLYGPNQEIAAADIERFGITSDGAVGTVADRHPAPRDAVFGHGGSLCFVVPAHGRAALSAVCFAQLADACRELRLGGLDAHVVVIAADENLALAQEHEFATITMSNRTSMAGLGAKFNAGYGYALSEGFDWVAALGSDSWIEPSRLLRYELPTMGEMLCTRNYTAIHPRAAGQFRLRVGYDGGIGTRVFKTEMLRICGHPPIEPGRGTGNDSATLDSLRAHQDVRLLYTDDHPYEIVGFQSKVQVTPYSTLRVWMVEESADAFEGLDKHFASKHIAAVRRFYEK